MEEVSQLRQERDHLTRLVVAEKECAVGRIFVPICDEEMHKWLEARQRDLHTARVSGQHSEVERMSTLIAGKPSKEQIWLLETSAR